MAKRIIESPVPFVLRKILIEKSSGELKLRGEGFEKTLYFIEGALCFAKTSVLHERLGEILFKIGKINQTQFWDIHKLLSGQKDKIGTLMVRNNLISPKDLHGALIYQTRVIALSTFSLTSGEWEFVSTPPDLPEDSTFKIDLPVVFVEGVQRFRSIPLFKKNFVNHELRSKSLPSDIRFFLNSAEIDFFQELQRFANGRAADVAFKMGVDEDTFWQKLVLFFLLNALEFAPVAEVKVTSENTEELIALHEKLKAKEMDHYDLLALKNTATFNEIKEGYYLLAKKFHPDRFGDSRDPELKEKANFVFARINKAFEVLSHEERRREYDMKGYKEIQSMERGSENLQEKANLFYRKAKTLYAQKKFWEAASIMEEAIRNDPGKPAYFLLLGLSQAGIPTMRRMAEKNLQKVVEMEPWNAEPLTALGLLFLAEKMDKRAENFFRRALAIDPDHEVSLNKIAELTGSDKKQSMFSAFKKKK